MASPFPKRSQDLNSPAATSSNALVRFTETTSQGKQPEPNPSNYQGGYMLPRQGGNPSQNAPNVVRVEFTRTQFVHFHQTSSSFQSGGQTGYQPRPENARGYDQYEPHRNNQEPRNANSNRGANNQQEAPRNNQGTRNRNRNRGANNQ